VLKITTGSDATSTGAKCGGPSTSNVGPASLTAAPMAASNLSVTSASASTPCMPSPSHRPRPAARSLLSAATRSLCARAATPSASELLLSPRPSAHAPQCDGVQRIAWRAT
jgi:hypothetical protein